MSPSVAKGKQKKLARIAALQNEKRTKQQQKLAASKRDLLEDYHAFRRYERSGISCSLEGSPGEDLSEADVDACVALQKFNCENSGAFDETASRAALQHPESRVLLMRQERRPEVQQQQPAATGALDDDLDLAEWDMLPEISQPSTSVDRAASAPTDEEGQLLGYMHLQFCVSEAPPLLCVLNMQLRAHVMGKGLGKFALQLVELMARQLNMELVMLYLKDGKVTTVRLSKHRLTEAHGTDRAPEDKAASDAEDDTMEPFELVSMPSYAIPSLGAAPRAIAC
jgi:hypothetical protein